MFDLALNGKIEAAQEINQRLMPLHTKLFVEANPIPVKWAAYQMGLIEHDNLRLPLTVLSESQQPIVKQALIDAKVL